MRFPVLILVVVAGFLALSLEAQPPQKAAPRTKFLDNVSVGEKIILRKHLSELTILVPTEQELQELVPTEDERRQCEKVKEFIRLARRQSDPDLETLSPDLKLLREQHGSLSRYVANIEQKMANKLHTVSAIGEDYLAYREKNHEVFLPARQITSLTRSIP